jgi:lysophospholipase L1-like esterase
LRNAAALFVWALVLAIGGGGVGWVSRHQTHRAFAAIASSGPRTLGERIAQARQDSMSRDPTARGWLANAIALPSPSAFIASRPRVVETDPAPTATVAKFYTVAAISAPEGAETLLRDAMRHAPRPTPDAAAPVAREMSPTVSAYGALTPEEFSNHRVTILQLGDSHTAADFFSGRVRERLQQAYGTGGDVYIVPGRPNVGVRSAVFDSEASEGWNYEALQRSDARRKFYLTGFNAVAHHAGASLNLRARGGRPYDRLEVAFLKEPGGGRAQVLLDGAPGGEIDLDGAEDQRATLDLSSGPRGYREISVRALGDGPVTVTGVDAGRDGEGVSYISLGFPGATVQVLQRLVADNFADDLRRMAPDIVVLAFGTNEGFNDNLDINNYTSQYEQIVRRLQEIRPGMKIVIIGPPDAARPAGMCHSASVGGSCVSPVEAQMSAGPGGGLCKFPVPPKLPLVREAQRKLAQRLGVVFWDWSSIMPGPCGAQIWAAASPPLMAHDFVHMTLEGYKQSADRFADFLMPLIDGRQTGAHVVSND